jgi:hypothetical protein
MAGVVVAAPSGSRVAVRIEISADFNVTAVAARQKANRYLLMTLGDQLHAGEPELMIGERLWWRVPVLLIDKSSKHGTNLRVAMLFK